MKLTANRYHDFSYGHRVVGHEGKCQLLHGHNGRIHFYCEADQLDSVGRVIDFSVIKERLCQWLEDNWDHKFLAWGDDNFLREIESTIGRKHRLDDNFFTFHRSIVWTQFNPTAENIGKHLLEVVGPEQLKGTGVTLVKVIVEETRKCSVTVEL